MKHSFWYISLLSLNDDEMEFVIFVFYRIILLKLETMIFFTCIQNSTP